MATDKGITLEKENPFRRDSWIKQGYPFTIKRQQQFEKLINQTAENILHKKPENENRYVAFVAIRWGFAKIEKERIKTTKKWSMRGNYNGYGQTKARS